MKYLLDNPKYKPKQPMKILRSIPLLMIFLLLVFPATAQPPYDGIPPRFSPPRLVNDFSGTLSSNEVARLERKLVAFNDTTSTQITVVLVKELAGYVPSQFADLLGEQWGVGQKDKDNGIVVLVKPKVGGTSGEAFIAPGYGLQGAVPDAIAKRIVEAEMIPEFKNNNYYRGLDRGTDVLMELTAGEYSADDYMKRSDGGGLGAFAGLIIFIIIIAWLLSRGRGMRNYSGRSSSLPFWTALFLANQMGGSSRGKWGSFQGGSGTFGGGGGGGFGGFGGGSFGGGGAGGSW
ncbi:MAG: TPM domain-containing protein [Clostridia bacterium]|nr:TPM domain-containing protein [Clostridia bacterium]